MIPEIEEAIQRGKTCAPVDCKGERVCFILAMECEKVHRQLDNLRTKLLAAGLEEFDLQPPTNENTRPMFGEE